MRLQGSEVRVQGSGCDTGTVLGDLKGLSYCYRGTLGTVRGLRGRIHVPARVL